MRVLIVGYGAVGSAQAHLMKYLGHGVTVYDPYKGFNDIDDAADVVFICVNEDAIDDAVRTLVSHGVKGLLVIKSTVPVGFTRQLMNKYGRHICHNPEFIRQHSALTDVLNPDRIVIGKCCDVHANLLKSIYEPLRRPIFIMSPEASELVKLASNAYLSMLISFWNEIYMLARKLGLDVREVADAVCADHRMSRYGTSKFGEPFGGRCLPKDLDMLIGVFQQNQLQPVLLHAVKKVNEMIRK